MKIYHTETQADYDALMVELEKQGFTWWTGNKKPTEKNYWHENKEKTCVRTIPECKKILTKSKEFYIYSFPGASITKYKAKVDEKMRFTKDNVLNLTDKWIENKTVSFQELQNQIKELDDTPEKVVVPKFVADFYEECENAALEFLITQLEATYSRSELGEWYRSCRGRHRNGRANAQEVIAKMKLDGYTIAPEKLYYIPLPDLETSDGIQQVLSKRKNDKRYFASRPAEALQQRYTKEELERVPEIYKPFAKPIEEEEEEE